MYKKALLISLTVVAGGVRAQELATCRAPAGHIYYHHAGFIQKAQAGWGEDKISLGVFTLSRVGANSLDILFVDSRNKPISTVQSGGQLTLLRNSSDNITVLVYYESALTEIYSFFKEKDGRHRFTFMQNRTGEDAMFPKSSLMVGDCDPIRFLK